MHNSETLKGVKNVPYKTCNTMLPHNDLEWTATDKQSMNHDMQLFIYV